MHSEAAGAVEAVEVDEADEAASGAVVVLRAVELEAEMIALDAVVTATIVTTGDATIDVAGVVLNGLGAVVPLFDADALARPKLMVATPLSSKGRRAATRKLTFRKVRLPTWMIPAS